MSYPHPSSLHDDGTHAVCVASGKMFTIDECLRSEYAPYSGQNMHFIQVRICTLFGPEYAPYSDLRFLEWNMNSLMESHFVLHKHSEPYKRVETTQLWYVLYVHCGDFQTFFSILKVFLAMPRQFLLSLPALPLYLTVLPR